MKVIGLLTDTFLTSSVRPHSRLVQAVIVLEFLVRRVRSPLQTGRPLPTLSICRVPIPRLLGTVPSICLTLRDILFLVARYIGRAPSCPEVCMVAIPLFRVAPTVLNSVVRLGAVLAPLLLGRLKFRLLVDMDPNLPLLKACSTPRVNLLILVARHKTLHFPLSIALYRGRVVVPLIALL